MLETVLEEVSLPRFARVRYEPETTELADVESTVRNQLDELPLSDLDRGAVVAIGVGSRSLGHGRVSERGIPRSAVLDSVT